MLATIVLPLLLTSWIASAQASTVSHLSSFFISPADEASKSVSLLTGTGSIARCRFDYATAVPDAKPTKQNSNQAQSHPADIEAFLGRLAGVCIRRQIEYWKYDVCFEGSVTQSHGSNSNSLGTYRGPDGVMQLYDNGTPCEALPDSAGRSSRIEFVCDKDLRIRSVQEESTCSYKVVVGAPIVCGHPDFNSADPAEEDSSDTSHEPWFFELVEADGGQVICSAYSILGDSQRESDYIHAGKSGLKHSRVDFKSFSLVLEMDAGSLSEQFHSCRAPGRRQLSKEQGEYSIQTKENDRRISLYNGKHHDGQLEYLVVQGMPAPV